MEPLPKVATERMEDSAYEQPVMKEAAAGLISFYLLTGVWWINPD